MVNPQVLLVIFNDLSLPQLSHRVASRTFCARMYDKANERRARDVNPPKQKKRRNDARTGWTMKKTIQNSADLNDHPVVHQHESLAAVQRRYVLSNHVEAELWGMLLWSLRCPICYCCFLFLSLSLSLCYCCWVVEMGFVVVTETYLCRRMHPDTYLGMFGSAPHHPSAVSSCARLIEAIHSSCSSLFFCALLATFFLKLSFDVLRYVFSSSCWYTSPFF